VEHPGCDVVRGVDARRPHRVDEPLGIAERHVTAHVGMDAHARVWQPHSSADYIRLDPSTRSHANERMMIGPAHRCLVNLETAAAT
jgi:hypothetical protein